MDKQRDNHFKKLFNPLAPDREDYTRILGLKGILTFFLFCVVAIVLLMLATNYVQEHFATPNPSRMTIEEWYKGVVIFWIFMTSITILSATLLHRHKMHSFVIGRKYSAKEMLMMADLLKESETRHLKGVEQLISDLSNQTIQYKDLKTLDKALKKT